jgi:glycosyltransferase involved in cell wall biosynthesis
MVHVIIVTSHRLGESLGGVESFVDSFSSWCCNKGIKNSVISRTLSVFSLKISYDQTCHRNNQKIDNVKKIKLPYFLYSVSMGFFSILVFVCLLKILMLTNRDERKTMFLHSQDLNFAAIPTVLAGKLFKVKTIIHQHGPFVYLLPNKNAVLIERLTNTLACELSDLIIVTDIYTERYVQEITKNKEKICILPAAVDDAFFENPSSEHKLGYYRVGYIGRLTPEKNLKTLITAFKKFSSIVNSPCKLIIVGDGELMSELKQLTSMLGVRQNVEFTGFKREVREYLSTFDVFVLPSKIEGTPISLLEAMAAGKAIICSNIPSINQIVDDGQNAFLFDADDADQLTSILLKLFNEPHLRKELGCNAQSKSKQYSGDIIFSKLLELYQKI